MLINIKNFPLKSTAVVISICWTVLIVSSVIWNETQHKQEINNILYQIGRASIARDILFRQWNSMHGGVYAPVTEATQPNKYLLPESVPLRDLTISPTLTLTLINPAYMTRQIYELAKKQNAISGHITSLDPVNPINQADSWETKALNALMQGSDEYTEMVTINDQKYMRMMIPLETKKDCLKCHAIHGYKVGDLRGGISISLPVASFHAAGYQLDTISRAHLIIWAIVLLGILIGFRALSRREAQRLETEKQIINLAHFDKLTGLVNRNLFQDRLTHALSMAKRQKKKVVLLFIDLDRFKPVNDAFGHSTGDAVLQEVATRLIPIVRESDTVGRIGGDEFVIILQNITDKREATPIAKKILTTLQHPFVIKGNKCSINASIGISCFPEDGDNMDMLLRKADDAMYQIKNKTGGGYAFFKKRTS